MRKHKRSISLHKRYPLQQKILRITLEAKPKHSNTGLLEDYRVDILRANTYFH